LAELKDS